MALSDTKILRTRTGFDIDPVATSLLNLRVLGGTRIDATGLHAVANVDITLPASDITFVEMSDAGVVSGNITGFTSGATQLYEVETDAENIIGVKDWRDSPDIDPTLNLGTAESITVAMMADLLRGSIFSGQASDRPAALVALTNAQILIGDGTDVVSVALSGDVTIDNAGVVTIAAGAVEGSMLAVPKVSVQTESLTAVSMTDGGSTVATKVLAMSIPKGAVLLGIKVLVSAGFAGDTSAAVTIGDGSDVDRYMTGTPNAFATAADGLEFGVPSGAKLLTAANTPTVTITSAADATNMIAGGGVCAISVYYIETL